MKSSQPRHQLVQTTAETLRERIFDVDAGIKIGTLNSLADDFSVGIVTVQQAARILEHEGLLEVRRGPGGGYFGRRPDIDTLERLLAAYMRSKPASWAEALDITSLLFIELCAAASEAEVPNDLHQQLLDIGEQLKNDVTTIDVTMLEEKFQDLLFQLVNRPLFELLTRVTLHFSASNSGSIVAQNLLSPEHWRNGRLHIIKAILAGDTALARFEADRSNRQIILDALSTRE
jgi:GntR family transcriptional repressor for pyruvate dehydrogenase complex